MRSAVMICLMILGNERDGENANVTVKSFEEVTKTPE